MPDVRFDTVTWLCYDFAQFCANNANHLNLKVMFVKISQFIIKMCLTSNTIWNQHNNSCSISRIFLHKKWVHLSQECRIADWINADYNFTNICLLTSRFGAYNMVRYTSCSWTLTIQNYFWRVSSKKFYIILYPF